MLDLSTFPNPSQYRWTTGCQRRFLLELAGHGSVNRAAAAVSKSRKSAYALLRRDKGGPFSIGWDTALLIAHRRIEGHLLEYATCPTEAKGYRHRETGRLMWRMTDPMRGAGMGMAHLQRLDKAVDAITCNPVRLRAAQSLQHRWPECLDTMLDLQPKTCYLARNSASFNFPSGGVRATVHQAKNGI